jgi:hypothetical protein
LEECEENMNYIINLNKSDEPELVENNLIIIQTLKKKMLMN